MKVILYLIRFSGINFFLSAGLSIIAGASGSFVIKSINEAIHNGIENLQHFLIIVGIGLIIFTIFSLIATRLLHEIIQNLIQHLTLNLGEKILKTPYPKVENEKDKIFTILSYDIYTISSVIEKVPNLFVAMAVVSGCVVYLLFLSVELSLMIVGMLLVVFLVLMTTNRRLTELSNRGRLLYDAYVAKTNALIFGIRELYQNTAHRDQFLNKEYQHTLDLKKRNSIKERVAIQFSDKLAESMALLGIAVILTITFTMDPSKQKTFSEVFTLSLFIVGPLTSITTFIKNLKPFNASINQIESLGLELGKEGKDNAVSKTRLNAPVYLENVVFDYPKNEDGNKFKVGPVTATFEPGTITFITGGNGSGKTTLGKIIAGLYTPTKGTIRCKHTAIESGLYEDYRNLFSVIWNDNYTFDNIQYTNWKTKNVEQHLKNTFLDKKTSLNDGIYSNIRLSSGQLKRLALVTSLLEDKDIYLFDEWAANQDVEFKELFYREVLPDLKKEGKTVIAISHDKAYFDTADQIMELREGKLTIKSMLNVDGIKQ